MSPALPTKTTLSERLTAIISYGVLLLLIYLVFRIFEPFLEPLAWAAVLVIFFYPMHCWLLRRFSPRKAAICSTVTILVLLIVPAIFMTTLFVREAAGIARGIQQSIVEHRAPRLATAWIWIAQHVPFLNPNIDIVETLQETIRDQARLIGERVGAMLRSTVIFLFNLFVMIFAMLSIFRYSGPVARALRSLLPFDADHREAIIAQARELISAGVGMGLALAVIQGVLGGLSFALVRLPAAFFWGVAMAFFSLVPVIGSGIIFVPAALWLGLNGRWGSAILVLAICAGVSAIIDNIVRPLLLGGRTEVSSFEIFVGVLGGISVFGLLGLVLGPVLVATAHSILTVYTDSVESPADGDSLAGAHAAAAVSSRRTVKG
jgi:predicted PurR-regulated permease PerM